jgi:hypothetical protein
VCHARRTRALAAQVKAARCIKRLLTGRLSSAVSSYPRFPGTEASYLRAQVTRGTCLVTPTHRPCLCVHVYVCG